MSSLSARRLAAALTPPGVKPLEWVWGRDAAVLRSGQPRLLMPAWRSTGRDYIDGRAATIGSHGAGSPPSFVHLPRGSAWQFQQSNDSKIQYASDTRLDPTTITVATLFRMDSGLLDAASNDVFHVISKYQSYALRLDRSGTHGIAFTIWDGGANDSVGFNSGPSIPDKTWIAAVARFDGTSILSDARAEDGTRWTTSAAHVGSVDAGGNDLFIGTLDPSWASQNKFNFGGQIAFVYIDALPWSDGLVEAFLLDPEALIRPDPIRTLSQVAALGAGDGATVALAGAVPGVSTAAGALAVGRAAAGQAASLSALSALLGRRRPLAGAVPGVSTVPAAHLDLVTAFTLLDGINKVLKRVGQIQGSSDELSTITDASIQRYIDVTIQMWNEAIDYVYSVSGIPLPQESATSNVTLATGTREYDLPSDLAQIRWPLHDETNSHFIWPYPVTRPGFSGYEQMRIDQHKPADFTGRPSFAVVNPTNGKLRMDAAPTAEENGDVYVLLYDKAFSLTAGSDSFPFVDDVVDELVLAVAQKVRGEMQNDFDRAAHRRAMASALRALNKDQRKARW